MPTDLPGSSRALPLPRQRRGRTGARLIRRALLLTGCTLVAASCASDGRELAEAPDWQTTTTRPLPPTSAPPFMATENGVELTSPEFEPGAATPIDLTCAGANRAPALSWTPIADEGVAELAITLSDQTDSEEPLLLWLVAGIDPSTTSLDAGALPAGAINALNDFGQGDWGNPCLETLSTGRRDLQFRLYLLSQPSGLQPGAPGNEAWDTLVASALDTSSLLTRIDAQP